VTASTRETAGSVRSAHVAYFMPADWARIAIHLAPALERAGGDSPAVRLLVLVPDAGAAVALSRALATLPAAKGRRIVAGTSTARLQRLLSAAPADCVIAAPETIAAALGAAALKLDAVKSVALVAADELDAESDALAAVLAEVPKEASRLLTALAPTEGVDALITRYMSRARRVQEDVVPADDAAKAPMVRYLTVAGNPLDSLPFLLDELDAPSAAILANNDADADAARELLASVGYTDGALATVTQLDVKPNTALVITLGVPTASAWTAAAAAQPAQIVTLCAPRDLEALRLLAGEATPRPLADRASISRARATEARRRAELRAELGESIPAREVLALEPLLREHDGLEIAAAALRLLERTRAQQAEEIHAAEARVRKEMKEAQKEKEMAEREERGESRPPRGEKIQGPRGFSGGDNPRGFGERKPRSTYNQEDRSRGDEKPRISSFSKDGERPRSGGFKRDDKPRSGGFSRDDKPRAGGFKRDDRPRTGGFKRDDAPRSGGFSRDDKPRSGGFKRDDRPRTGGFKRDDKPRSGGGRPPRGDR
jgi:hypothetical protein